MRAIAALHAPAGCGATVGAGVGMAVGCGVLDGAAVASTGTDCVGLAVSIFPAFLLLRR